MVRSGAKFNHLKGNVPENFTYHVGDSNFKETWAEGVSIFYNPYAKNPLNKNIFSNIRSLWKNDKGHLDGTIPKFQQTAYYPFGLDFYGTNYSQIGPVNHFKYSGKELQSDFGLNWYDFGARFYDVQLGRWHCIDPHASKYPGWSPYNFIMNKGPNAIDPDGKDVYLVVWATADGKVGHAGIAIDNYISVPRKVVENGREITKFEYVKDGTVTYHDLWPGSEVTAFNATENVPASYNVIETTVDNIINTDVTGLEGYAPDGLIKLSTDFSTDRATMYALEKFRTANSEYNGVNCNCSDFAEAGIETVTGKQLNVNENFIMFYGATTPNQLFKETSKQSNATILKDPGDKINNTFTEGMKTNSNPPGSFDEKTKTDKKD